MNTHRHQTHWHTGLVIVDNGFTTHYITASYNALSTHNLGETY